MNKGLSAAHMPMAVAVYLPEQYPRLLATAEDASDLEATWQEWHQVLQETRQKMAVLGLTGAPSGIVSERVLRPKRNGPPFLWCDISFQQTRDIYIEVHPTI